MTDTSQRARALQTSLEEFALTLPDAWVDTPWGDDHVTKVRKRIFAFYGTDESPGLTVKLRESVDHGLAMPGAEPTGYGLGRHGWVSIPLARLRRDDAEVLYDFVEESYRAVAPKTLVRRLDEEHDDPEVET